MGSGGWVLLDNCPSAMGIAAQRLELGKVDPIRRLESRKTEDIWNRDVGRPGGIAHRHRARRGARDHTTDPSKSDTAPRRITVQRYVCAQYGRCLATVRGEGGGRRGSTRWCISVRPIASTLSCPSGRTSFTGTAQPWSTW